MKTLINKKIAQNKDEIEQLKENQGTYSWYSPDTRIGLIEVSWMIMFVVILILDIVMLGNVEFSIMNDRLILTAGLIVISALVLLGSFFIGRNNDSSRQVLSESFEQRCVSISDIESKIDVLKEQNNILEESKKKTKDELLSEKNENEENLEDIKEKLTLYFKKETIKKESHSDMMMSIISSIIVGVFSLVYFNFGSLRGGTAQVLPCIIIIIIGFLARFIVGMLIDRQRTDAARKAWENLPKEHVDEEELKTLYKKEIFEQIGKEMKSQSMEQF